jgi:hypothetical protein
VSQDHEVVDGDCLHSIAQQYGFFPDTLWSHARNRALRDRRKDGGILHPGDVLHIPDKRSHSESAADGRRHRFRRRGVPAQLRLRFNRRVADESRGDAGPRARFGDGTYEDIVPEAAEPKLEPIADEAFVVNGDVSFEGRTDGDGMAEIPIVPEARSATLRFFADTPEELAFELSLGELDPVATPRGARQRLSNLNYGCPADGDEMDAELIAALRALQAAQGLTVSGELDAATQDELVALHGA